MVSVHTKLVALLGSPLGFTMAPAMHNTTYAECGLDYLYFPVECSKADLPVLLSAFRRMNFAGFAVTKPLKMEIMGYLDEVTPLAAKIGAVNTVKNEGGRLVGYNTDGYGFAQSLYSAYGDYTGKTMFVFGVGGASRSLCFDCAERGIRRIYLCSRHENTLASELIAKAGIEAIWIPQYTDAVPDYIAQSDILVNASGVGMEPHLGETPVDSSVLRPDLFVCDLAYNPPATRLLLDAEQAGCRTMNGLKMVAYQGARQFEIFTGKSAPYEKMLHIVEQAL